LAATSLSPLLPPPLSPLLPYTTLFRSCLDGAPRCPSAQSPFHRQPLVHHSLHHLQGQPPLPVEKYVTNFHRHLTKPPQHHRCSLLLPVVRYDLRGDG